MENNVISLADVRNARTESELLCQRARVEAVLSKRLTPDQLMEVETLLVEISNALLLLRGPEKTIKDILAHANRSRDVESALGALGLMQALGFADAEDAAALSAEETQTLRRIVSAMIARTDRQHPRDASFDETNCMDAPKDMAGCCIFCGNSDC
jgi:hypothetical protein